MTAPTTISSKTFFPSKFKTTFGYAEFLDYIPVDRIEHWKHSFSKFDHDHRVYEITSLTLSYQFNHYYLFLFDKQQCLQAIQPFFLVRQDLLKGVSPALQRIMENIRKFFPGFLFSRILMVGSATGEGDLANPSSSVSMNWVSEALHEILPTIAQQLRASLIVLKDFPKSYRPVLNNFAANGYTRLPSMPATKMDLNFEDFDDYVSTSLSKRTRRNLRRKFREAERFMPLRMEVVTNLTAYIDDVYPLYKQVVKRARLKFEKLNRDYFIQLSRTMPDKMRFFLWRYQNRIVAFNACLVSNGTLYDKCIGLDYTIALDAHLYFTTLRDVLNWAVKNKIKTYHSAPLNYDPKLHLRQKLVPLDLYARRTSDLGNFFFGPIIRFLGPTRYDRTLPRFANFKDLE